MPTDYFFSLYISLVCCSPGLMLGAIGIYVYMHPRALTLGFLSILFIFLINKYRKQSSTQERYIFVLMQALWLKDMDIVDLLDFFIN